MRIAAVAGAVLYVMMWSVVLPPDNNVFMDDHLIFAAVLVGLALVGAGDTFGIGRHHRLLISAVPGACRTTDDCRP
jgi:thiosulfate dehydrogenase (quinone) large subunit